MRMLANVPAHHDFMVTATRTVGVKIAALDPGFADNGLPGYRL
jgi:hypothetical protein